MKKPAEWGCVTVIGLFLIAGVTLILAGVKAPCDLCGIALAGAIAYALMKA